MKNKKGFWVALILPLVLAAASLSHASLKGAPFLPEEDARFDALEGNSVVNAKPGFHAKQIAVATYDFTKMGGSSTLNGGLGAGVYDLGVILPTNAVIVRDYLYTKVTPAGTNATLAFSCAAANDILSATSTIAVPISEGVSTGASTVFKNISAACHIKATIGTAALTAGNVTAYIEYVVHP